MDNGTDLSFLPDRPFNPNLYPKEYVPSTIRKVSYCLIFIVSINPIFWPFFANDSQNHMASLFAAMLALFLYYSLFRFLFGYKVILHTDKVEVQKFLFKKTEIPRKEILYYCRGSYLRNTAVCLVTKRNKFYIDTTKIDHYVVTHDEFERDRDFFDWFNTLEAKTDFPLQRLHEKAK